MKTRARTHTRLLLSIIIIVSAGEESALLFVITGVWSEREGFSRGEKRMDGKVKKKTERAGQKKHVCDILVTFYRNCCSTPSHTCKKKKKAMLWECALQWMASKVLSGVFSTKGKRSFVADWYGFKNITAMGRGLFRFLSLGLQLGLTPSKLHRLCHL